MSGFKFRFEAVSTVRKKKEEEAMLSFAQEQVKFRETVQRKYDLLDAMNRSLQRREQLGSDAAVNSTAFYLEDSFIKGQKKRLVSAEREIQRAAKRLNHSYQVFLDARKEAQVVEKLRERDKSKFKKEQNKLEQKRMNELYVTRARFTSKGGLDE